MAEFHFIYMRHAIDDLTHDAIMAEAARYGIDTPKKFLNMIVSSEITRMTDRFQAGLTDDEIAAYGHRECDDQDKKLESSEIRNSDLNDMIPY